MSHRKQLPENKIDRMFRDLYGKNPTFMERDQFIKDTLGQIRYERFEKKIKNYQ